MARMSYVYGTAKNSSLELIQGTNGDDLIFPLGGWDYVNGKDGMDTVVVAGLSSQFRIVQDNSITYIDSLSGASTYAERVQLTSIEQVRFNDVLVTLDQPRLFVAQAGDDEYQGAAGTDWVVYPGPRNQYLLQAIGPTWRVSDYTGQSGADTLRGVERVRFADGVWLTAENQFLGARSHASYSDLPAALYQFFVVAFDAVPGVTYMEQLAQAWRFGYSVQTIVEVFTTKPQFTQLYPPSLSHPDLAGQLVDRIVGDSATSAARLQAADDIQAALDAGWSVGSVIHTVFGNLAGKSDNDADWGQTVRLFKNQLEVSRYMTEVVNLDSTDVELLRALLGKVTTASQTQSTQDLAHLARATLTGLQLIDEFSGHTPWIGLG